MILSVLAKHLTRRTYSLGVMLSYTQIKTPALITVNKVNDQRLYSVGESHHNRSPDLRYAIGC